MDKVLVVALSLLLVVECQQKEHPAAQQAASATQEPTIDVGGEFSPASVTVRRDVLKVAILEERSFEPQPCHPLAPDRSPARWPWWGLDCRGENGSSPGAIR